MAVAKISHLTIGDFDGVKFPKKIGHNTMAKSVSGGVMIEYHGNEIVFLKDNMAYLSNAGWDTVTTSGRLHQFALENGRFKVGIQKGDMYLYNFECEKLVMFPGAEKWIPVNVETKEVLPVVSTSDIFD